MTEGLISILLRVYQDSRYLFDRLPLAPRETPSERTILRNRIKRENPLIIDVGANLGSSVAFYRRLYPHARIVAFEPDPETFGRLRRRHGNASNVTLMNCGVGALPGRLTLQRNTHSSTNSFLEVDQASAWVRATPGFRTMEPVEVEVVTLDATADRLSLDRVDFVKSDTQGFEPEVLKGAKKLLEEKRIRLLRLEVMCGRFYQQSVSLFDIESILHPFGYRLISLGGLHFDDTGELRYFDTYFALDADVG
jgi:FkbM family methyltransferase